MGAIVGLLRWTGRLALSMYLSTLLVFVAIELSISGGMAGIVLGEGSGVVELGDAEFEQLPSGLREQIETFSLRDPVPVRHAAWVVDAAQGDLGRSLRNQPVQSLLTPRLSISLEIALVGLGLAIMLGIGAGLLGALLTGPAARGAHAFTISAMQGTPAFLLATIGTWFFAVRFGWLPAAGWERISSSPGGNLRHLAMPALAIALPEGGMIARVVMTSTREVLGEEYIVAATSKGLRRRQVFLRHVLRPASLTLFTQIGLVFGSLLGGVIVVERLFGIGGLGAVLFEASLNRDLHVIAAITAYVTFVIVVVRTLSDVAYRWADPRIR